MIDKNTEKDDNDNSIKIIATEDGYVLNIPVGAFKNKIKYVI